MRGEWGVGRAEWTGGGTLGDLVEPREAAPHLILSLPVGGAGAPPGVRTGSLRSLD